MQRLACKWGWFIVCLFIYDLFNNSRWLKQPAAHTLLKNGKVVLMLARRDDEVRKEENTCCVFGHGLITLRPLSFGKMCA